MNLSQDEIELILLYRRLTSFEKFYTKKNLKRYIAYNMKIPVKNIKLKTNRIFIKLWRNKHMNDLTKLKIKAMSFDRLIKELHSLKDMYIDFSNNTDNIISCSAFHIMAKDLETLLKKYE